MMSLRSKVVNMKNPTLLLNTYNILSLLILICCIVVIACIYTVSYVREEKVRANISLQQLQHFFDFQYRAISEELWTENYDSISMRVNDIAKRFGNATYRFYILDNNKKCLATASTNSDLTKDCSTSSGIKDLFKNYNEKFSFNLDLRKYIYFGQLKVEPEKIGYIYIEISDPFNFYRGSLLSKLWGSFFLKLLAVILIWIFWLLISKKLILRPYFASLAKAEKKEALGGLAAQVAHDIKSPLAALEMIIQSTSSISEDKRILIRSAVCRVRDIANNLLLTHRKANENLNEEGGYNEPLTCQLAATLIENILTEKRLEFRSKIAIKIDSFLHSEESYGLFIKVPLSNFKRVISNIINNSVESIKNSGTVNVILKQNINDVKILIQDTGVGISPKVISMLGQPGVSYGKSNGNGLGIFHANKILANCAGNLHIDSTLNEGTTVKIVLPKANQPTWFTKNIIIKPDHIICIIDDDESIHQIWDKRFSKDNLPYETINVYHFSSPTELLSWYDTHKNIIRNILYFCDYEFLKNDINGIEIIRKLCIESQSVLVTSHYEEQKIQNNCLKFGIKLLPKCMAAYVPLIFEKDDLK